MATRRWEEQIDVNVRGDKVFAYVSDFTKHREWSGHGLEATKTSDGPVAVGTTYATTAKQFGTQKEDSTITDMSASSSFAWDSRGALGRAHHWFSIDAHGDQVTLKKGAELVEPTFLAKMTGFRIGKDIPKSLRSDLEKIKATLEGQ